MHVRSAKKSEIDWINQCYDEVRFMHSDFEKELIAIAEVNHQKAGLGRLVTIDRENLELGGIYVLEPFRGKGVAKEIVAFLLKNAPSFQPIYCIPFKHLVPFYEEFGFSSCVNPEEIPKDLLDKYTRCTEKYTHPVSLLVLTKVKAP